MHQEIAIALKAKIPVIPVILTDAKRPTSADLPAALEELADCQAVRFQSRHSDPDLPYLVRRLREGVPRLTANRFFEKPVELDDTVPPSRLLRSDHGIVPFLGRAAELNALTAWADSPERISVFLVTGQAGQGKSRLAHYLSQRLSADGWWAGVISEHATAEDAAHIARLGTRVLIVVDEAEGDTLRVGEMLSTLARLGSSRIRLLLLARSRGAWIDTLTSHNDDLVAEAIYGLSEGMRELSLSGPETLPHRAECVLTS
ncbi:hypothetical protein [Acrocarpospora sp. B8E8]|uniref:P-loop NTPase n=1 Tax=Acrocarpospora sp. B8E8 TaxID=3153572 RepID=UPI00325D8205